MERFWLIFALILTGAVGLHAEIEEPRELDEVVVTASRVKMVVRGDTLVYDGDAFALARGSMLEQLIDQLPAVELKRDGRIYVNGCFVSELTINGEDFFPSDHKVALENLPAYMVKTVRVYRKSDWERRFKTREEYPIVMDVILKESYRPGWMANVQTGAGTSGRFLGRLFGMMYTPDSRLTLVGNVNNVNDERKPGQTDNWNPDWLTAGRARVAMGAIDYIWDARPRDWHFETNLTVKERKSTLESEAWSEQYQSGGSLFGHDLSDKSDRRLTLSTVNKVSYTRPGRLWLELTPRASLERTDVSETSRSTTSAAAVSSDLLNTLHEISKSARRTLTVGSGASGRIQLPGESGDVIRLKADVEYQSESYRTRKLRTLLFELDPSQNLFTNPLELMPRRKLAATASAEYGTDYRFSRWLRGSVGVTYGYSRTNLRSTRDYFRMELLGDEEPSVTLPSVSESIINSTFYPSNSFDYRLIENCHTLELDIVNLLPEMRLFGSDYQPKLQARVAVNCAPGHIAYHQADRILTARRSPWFVDPKIDLTIKELGALSYAYVTTLPGLKDQLDVTDAADPLNIYLGNPDLRPSRAHQLRIILDRIFRRGPLFEAEFNRYEGLIASSATHNLTTGVTTYRPMNVNGNWNLMGRLYLHRRLDRNDRWRIEAGVKALYENSVDMLGEQLSTVRNLSLNEKMKLTFRIMAGMEIAADVNTLWHRATSPIESFTPVSAVDVDYGLRFRATDLPWNLTFITDFIVHSRRGYSDTSLNSSDIIWNARLAKHLLDGRLTVAVDGFDILGQLGNVTQTLNSQGRIETRFNTLPRYAIIHLTYRFSKN